MKAIVFADLLPVLAPKIAAVAPDMQWVPIPASGALPPEAAGADIFYYNYAFPRDIVASVIRSVPGLRWIHAINAGVDHLLCPELVASDILFTNSVGAHAVSISESVIGMLLFTVKRFGGHWDAQKEHRWGRVPKDELHARTLGIIGLGHVGLELARLAKAFEMRVLATRRTPQPAPNVDAVWGSDSLPRLLAESDFVVMCAALTPETRGMMGERELRQMKPSAYFVNIARGALVDENALVRALREGWIAGACLDAFVHEPLPPEHPFWTLPNCFVTPHSSANTPQLTARALDIFVENVRRYRAGEPLLNVVDKRRGY
ncbi:MAG: D-2-hydroxyacid dehydrogenase [Chloroflexi bacterium]|nr:D-2-hydroxyacid dehydrogenase [Chloroflexota bacterium]